MTLNEANSGQQHHIEKYEILAKTALLSAKINAPKLQPLLIYNGQPNQFTSDMTNMGAEIIFHKLSFEIEIVNNSKRDDLWKQIAMGAYLRLDIPDVLNSNDTILYTDTDIIFLKDPTEYLLTTDLIAASSEFEFHDFSKINTGSMVINLEKSRDPFRLVREKTIDNLDVIEDYDQGALRLFLNRKWDHLHQFMNWKPYWGVEEKAIILHFHGPKPHDFNLNNYELNNNIPIYDHLFNLSKDGYKNYLEKWINLYNMIQ